jgi:serine protease Do
LVAEVTEDGPAEKAGIERGDVVIAFNGTAVKNSHELPVLVAQTPVGDKAKVTLLHSGQEKTLLVKIGELADQQAKASGSEDSGESWGMTVSNITPEVARRFQLKGTQKGVIVTNIDPGSSAQTAQLKAGDVIEEVNRQPIDSVEIFNKVIAGEKDKETLLLLTRRGNATAFFSLRKQG